jgi:2-polyprenyl-3-methyl-5-hydroxy-6-metoxy-1,4-benzoquinol methylase
MIRFGKSGGFLIELKKDLFEQNDLRLERRKQLAQLYASQPGRKKCKNCSEKLDSVSFQKMGVQYRFCVRCGHLNGLNEDTEAFCAAIYTKDEGESYAQTYFSENKAAFDKRVKQVYLPKAQFLKDALQEMNEDPLRMDFADIGAGSGYFVAALLASGCRNVMGYEVSKSQVAFGNSFLKRTLLKQHGLSDVVGICAGLEAQVVSLIGVLEHLQEPRELLTELVKNSNVQYLFFSLPLFSLCVFFEMVFPEVVPRHLVAGHTHLYTKSSIDFFCAEFGLEKVAEWWFGADMFDLYRNITVMLSRFPENKGMVGRWDRLFRPQIDGLQLEIDKQYGSSEVHMLVRVCR